MSGLGAPEGAPQFAEHDKSIGYDTPLDLLPARWLASEVRMLHEHIRLIERDRRRDRERADAELRASRHRLAHEIERALPLLRLGKHATAGYRAAMRELAPEFTNCDRECGERG